MKEEQRRKYWQMYTDAWRLFDKYKDYDHTDDFFEKLLVEAEELNNKHNSELMKNVLMDTMVEVEILSGVKTRAGGCSKSGV